MLQLIKSLSKPAVKRAIITAGLEASGLVGRAGLMRSARGLGAIFTLHNVRPPIDRAFHPNDLLDITPEFLDEVLHALTADDYEFVSLEEVPVRLASPGDRPFACFTLDDGFRNNIDHAAPVFARHRAPYTIFVAKGFIEATHSMWWETLAVLLNKVTSFSFDFGTGSESVSAATPAEKLYAFNRVRDFISGSDEAGAVAQLDRVAEMAGISPLSFTLDLTMRADALKAALSDPLLSLGAHTISHRALAMLPDSEAEREMLESVATVEAITGKRPVSFAYPYGSPRAVGRREGEILRRIGVPIGLTTRPAVLRPEMARDMVMLPRISINGLFQKARYVRALASGIPLRLGA